MNDAYAPPPAPSSAFADRQSRGDSKECCRPALLSERGSFHDRRWSLQSAYPVHIQCPLQDLDFENRRIRADRQLVRERGRKYYVEKTKTECSCRFISMTEKVYQSLNNILERRKKIKREIIEVGTTEKQRKSGWKRTGVPHYLLHHLPVNLRRFTKNSAGFGQNIKIEKSAGKPVISRFEGLWRDI